MSALVIEKCANGEYNIPPFNQIKPDDIVASIDKLLNDNLTKIEALIDRGPYTLKDFILPLEALSERLNRAFAPISHLHSVKSTPALRQAYQEILPKITEYHTYLSQHTGLYAAFEAVKNSQEYHTYTKPVRTLIDHALRDFKLSGVHLPKNERDEIALLEKQLSELSRQFEENVLDATEQWQYHVSDVSTLKGMPRDALARAQQKALDKKLTGAILTLDYPCYHAVMTFVEDEHIRQKTYEAFNTRASDAGPHAHQFDNTDIIWQTLCARKKLAQLLGFNSFAEYSIKPKMANTPEEVIDFLEKINEQTNPGARREWDELNAFADKKELLQAWDIAFYSEKMRQAKFDVSQEAMRPYFPLPHVLNQFFELIECLYNISFKTIKTDVTWDDEVIYVELYKNKQKIGAAFCDFYARQQKRGGAWMDECQNKLQQANGKEQLPIAFVTCNFSPPSNETPSLLTHQDVETLFHEFGHALHHLLTQITLPSVGGVHGVPWDAVEFPSQIMEEWCWDKTMLKKLSQHVTTHEPLPERDIDKLINARYFQEALFRARQLEFALFDFTLHQHFNPTGSKNQVLETLAAIRKKVSVTPIATNNRFSHSFSHIFAGGYAAGYYSYQWAEVMAKDGFKTFKREGIFNTCVGERFLNEYLSLGGSEDPMALFVKFTGHKPDINVLFEHV